MFLRSLLLSLLISSPAWALSCMPYGVTDAYRDAAAAEEDYIVVLGKLTFDETKLPKTDWENQEATPQHSWIKARIDGNALTRDGFNVRFNKMIEMDVRCFGPWCASPQSGIDYLVFLKRDGARHVLEATPCGGFSFMGLPKQLEQVQACIRGEPCKRNSRR